MSDGQRKTLVIIFGPPAVGKMTVGYELSRLTGLPLFHNHLTIDPVLRFFPFGHPSFQRLVGEFRTRIFEEVAASELPGLIFTYVWALDDERDKAFVDRLCGIFRERGGDVYFVELEASLEERLRRNETEFRLAEKPPKRNLESSRQSLLEIDGKYRLNSKGDFFYPEHYLRLDNTSLPAAEAAKRIADALGLATSVSARR